MVGGFDEGHVRAGVVIRGGALDRRVVAFGRNGVGAGNDQEVAVAAGVHRGLDLLHHLGGRDHLLSGEMAATLGKDLVLDLERVGARAFQQLDGAHHVQGIAETGVGVDHERSGKDRADRRHVLRDLGHGHQPDIGNAEKGIGDAGAGDIGGGKALIGHDAGRERIGDTRQQQRRAGTQHGAKLAAGHTACHRGSFHRADSRPVLFTAREMDHYSQCGGDPNIVLHGMAAIAGMRMSGADRGSPGSDARESDAWPRFR